MSRVTRSQAVAYARQRGLPANVIAALGDYSEGDSNTHPNGRYNESTVFRSPFPGETPGPGTQRPDGLVQPPMEANLSAASTSIFNTFPGSVQVGQFNPRRNLIIIQNQANTNLYVNFGAGASLNNGVQFAPGEGLVLDQGVPGNAVWYAFGANPTSGAAIFVEGALTS